METFEEALAVVEKLEDAELKGKLTTVLKDMNIEKAKAKGDISKLKAEFQTQLEDANGKVSKYKDVAKILSDAGIDAKNANEVLAKLNVQKTQDDELAEAKRLLKEKDEKLNTFETERQKNLFKAKMNPLLEKALENYKNDKGEVVKISPDFIDQEALNKPLDLENEPLVTDRLNKVLEAAAVKQNAWFERNSGIFGKNMHKVPTGGDKHFSGNKGIDLTKIAEAAMKSPDKSPEGLLPLFAVTRQAKKE